MSRIYYIDNKSVISTKDKVKKILSALGGMEKYVSAGSIVLLKPNFVAPFPNATTNFEILEELVREIRNCNGKPIIAESSGFEFDTHTTFKSLGVYDFVSKNKVELINLNNEGYFKVRLNSGIIREVLVSDIVRKADVIINIPKLKRHSLTKLTAGVKNLFGFLSRESRRKLHAFNLETGIFELSKVIKSDLVIVDGTVIGSKAVYGRHEDLGLVAGGTDVYEIDMFCSKFLDINYLEVKYLKKAIDKEIVREDYEIKCLNHDNDSLEGYVRLGIQQRRLIFYLRRLIYQLCYIADIFYSRIYNGQSLIPLMHYYLGVRPYLNKNKCTCCGDCIPICPVHAIKIPEKKIIPKLCMPVRCLKCIPVCQENAISLRGTDVKQNINPAIK
jgi:uncharacterized protein (DUF362 family)/ferredoxin